MRWSSPTWIYSTFIFSLSKKDRFADIDKIDTESRFVLRWDNSQQFARNPHTRIFRFTQKTIKNEQTTTDNQIKRVNRLRGEPNKLHGI